MKANDTRTSAAQTVLMKMSLQAEYRSSGVGLARDFLAHVLPAARLYKRAVGFFNSSVFGVASDAWENFFHSGGVVQLVCSECFSQPDVTALRSAVIDRPRWRRRQLQDVLPPREGSGNADLLAWLVANDRLQIKVAFLEPPSGYSIYHEKIGIFEDAEQSQVAISGSANESANAWQGNYERLDVFTSWGGNDSGERCRNVRRAFSALWQDSTSGTRVIGLAECVLSGKLRTIDSADKTSPPKREFAPSTSGQDLRTEPRPMEVFVPPADIQLFEHQRNAISAWMKGGGRGILEMATGSGKTITALHASSMLYDGIGPGMAIVIVAPFIHLMDQWISIARNYGLRPIRCAEGLGSWQAQLAAGVDALNAQRRSLLSIATTAATMGTEAFKAQVGRIRGPLLFVGDEAHNYGAASSAAALPMNANLNP